MNYKRDCSFPDFLRFLCKSLGEINIGSEGRQTDKQKKAEGRRERTRNRIRLRSKIGGGKASSCNKRKK